MQIRVFNALVSHMYFSTTKHFSPTSDSTPYGPAALFQPSITTSYAPLTECDYNLHKSNSTYFSDLDASRSHLVCSLLRQGIQRLIDNPGLVLMPDGKPAKGHWSIMLGSVFCSFKKEIKPLESYEMWTRILCWDRKWMYIVTHFVKKGAVKPDGYTLDDGSFASRVFGTRGIPSKKQANKPATAAATDNLPHKAIFATAISKYVMKLGRFTVHPEVVIDGSGLLPPKPGGWNTMSDNKKKTTSNDEGVAAAAATEFSGPSANGSSSADTWDWKAIEAENARGLEFAHHFAALDGLAGEFTGEETPAIGVFRDLLW